ncbi:MAG TPA: hypothetical protein PL082_03585 [Tepidiformaceae bacterium]|nr:hypothetical protein [Tepidiformaceae bacterium]
MATTKPRVRKVGLAPLRLVGTWVEVLSLTSAEGDATSGIETRVSSPDVLRNPGEPQDYFVRLRVWASDPETCVDLTIAGRFELASGEDDPEAQRMVEYNAPAILYGVARGIVAAVSAIAGRERLELPSIDLARLIDG